MSIIYEALKKTQNLIRADLKSALNSKSEKSKYKIKIITLYTLVICLGLVIGNLLIGFLNHPAESKTAKNIPMPAAPLLKVEGVSKPVEIISEEPKLTPPVIKVEPGKPFVLNGIFFSRDEGYALINNQIVKMGDTVDGAMVSRITADEVELNSSGNTIKLNRSR